MSRSAWFGQLRSYLFCACRLEAQAYKPGNVHPGASFEDLTYRDLIMAADAVAPVLCHTASLGLGEAVWQSVMRTKFAVTGNPNLGLILLLAPLAAVPEGTSLQDGIADVLANITDADTDRVYDAIRIANPGGLGRVTEGDVLSPPTGTLVEMMTLAAERDLIAQQYATDFSLVLGEGLDLLETAEGIEDQHPRAIVRLAVELHARYPDSLIARKCGPDTANEASQKARAVLRSGWPESWRGEQKFEEFDQWLRADGHKRNPGTIADLVGAILFAALRDGRLASDAEK